MKIRSRYYFTPVQLQEVPRRETISRCSKIVALPSHSLTCKEPYSVPPSFRYSTTSSTVTEHNLKLSAKMTCQPACCASINITRILSSFFDKDLAEPCGTALYERTARGRLIGLRKLHHTIFYLIIFLFSGFT